MVLKDKLNAGLLEAGKSLSEEKLENVISIFSLFEERIEWYPNWTELGFYSLYLAALRDDFDTLLILAELDKEIGWFSGRDDFEFFLLKFVPTWGIEVQINNLLSVEEQSVSRRLLSPKNLKIIVEILTPFSMDIAEFETPFSAMYIKTAKFSTQMENLKELENIDAKLGWVIRTEELMVKYCPNIQNRLRYEFNRRGNPISINEIEKISQILRPMCSKKEWDSDWLDDGISTLYLACANQHSNFDDMIELVDFDKENYLFCGDHKFEENKYKYMATKVIFRGEILNSLDKISRAEMDDIVSILNPFLSNVFSLSDEQDEDFSKSEWDEHWFGDGLSVLYLKCSNLNANFDVLMKLVEFDRRIEMFCGNEELEKNIFKNKCFNIINMEQVVYFFNNFLCNSLNFLVLFFL